MRATDRVARGRTAAAVPPASAIGTCGGAPGSASIDAGGLQIAVPAATGTGGFGGAQYNLPSGITLNAITALSYTERYDGPSTSDAPLLETSAASAVASGTWATWDVVLDAGSQLQNFRSGS
jgi:hypothetical protein